MESYSTSTASTNQTLGQISLQNFSLAEERPSTRGWLFGRNYGNSTPETDWLSHIRLAAGLSHPTSHGNGSGTKGFN